MNIIYLLYFEKWGGKRQREKTNVPIFCRSVEGANFGALWFQGMESSKSDWQTFQKAVAQVFPFTFVAWEIFDIFAYSVSASRGYSWFIIKKRNLIGKKERNYFRYTLLSDIHLYVYWTVINLNSGRISTLRSKNFSI